MLCSIQQMPEFMLGHGSPSRACMRWCNIKTMTNGYGFRIAVLKSIMWPTVADIIKAITFSINPAKPKKQTNYILHLVIILNSSCRVFVAFVHDSKIHKDLQNSLKVMH